MQPTRGLYRLPNCQAIFFQVGILPLTTASAFLTIQLEPFPDRRAQAEVSGNFLFSANQTLQPRASDAFPSLAPYVPSDVPSTDQTS